MTESIPARLSRLPDLAYDLSWTWGPGRDVFRRLDYTLWRESSHNPVMMLNRITAEVIMNMPRLRLKWAIS